MSSSTSPKASKSFHLYSIACSLYSSGMGAFRLHCLLFFDGGDGESVRKAPIPDEYKEQAMEYKWKLLEALGDVDDDMAMMFLEEEMPSNEDLRAAIRKYTILEKFVPVFMGASFKNKGVQPLLDSVIEFLPSPKDIE